jgi:bleomycin hydrolase
MLSIILKEYVDAKKPTPSPRWLKAQGAIMDLYLGKMPTMAKVDGKEVNPTELLSKYKFNPDDYVELTSYMHHPWYKTFNLEVPDNWSHDHYYNLPLDELMEVMHNSLKQGYSFVWDGDVSDPHFNHRMGAALVPLTDTLGFVPQKERHITQQERQDAFISWKSTDDHLMHVTGLSKDKEGVLFFKTKNSWGTGNNPFGGYLFMSESYMRLNTVAIMVHKDAIPKHIAKKLFPK